jgi:hypothetical protein
VDSVIVYHTPTGGDHPGNLFYFAPAATPTPTPTPSTQNATFVVYPSSQTVSAGSTFTVAVAVLGANPPSGGGTGAIQFTLAYSPTVATVQSIASGGFVGSTGRSVFPLQSIDNVAGTVTYGESTMGLSPAGPTGDGVLAVLTLQAAATPGQSGIVFTAGQLSGVNGAGDEQVVSPMIGGDVTVQ